MGRSRWDWTALQTDYVAGVLKPDGTRHWPSTRELAALRGVPWHYLRRVANQKKWTEKRSRHMAELEAAKLDAARQNAIETLRQVDENAAMLARAGLAVAAEMISRRDKATGTSQLKPNDLATLASAVSMLQKTAHLSLGAATEITDVRHRGGVAPDDEYFDIMAALHDWKPSDANDADEGRAPPDKRQAARRA